MSELENLLLSAKEEIQTLRRRNEILEAKVEMIDLFSLTLRTFPAYRSQGVGLDVAYAIQEYLQKLLDATKEKP